MHIALKPVERLLFATDLVLVADFRCAADEKLFRNSGPSNANCIVFPSTCTKILRAGGRATFEHPADVSFMNRGEEYEREASAKRGLHHVVRSTTRCSRSFSSTRIFEGSSFPQPQRHVPARTILDQRRLYFAAFREGHSAGSHAGRGETPRSDANDFRSAQRAGVVCPAVVSRATEYLLAHYTRPVSLSDVARAAGVGETI